MQAKTPQDFFNIEAPTRFKAEKARGIDVIALLNLIGPNGGDWTVIIRNQKMNISEGTHPTPTLMIKMNEDDFMNIIQGKLSAEKAFFLGKIQIKGNIAIALKLKEAGIL